MAIDSRFAARAQEFAAAGFLAVAIGGGWYFVPEDAEYQLEFVEVGWWNIRDFSSSSRDAQEIEHIASAVSGIDVLAVGELNDDTVLEALVTELGPSWRSAQTAQKVGRSSGSREHYGFVWNSDVVVMEGDVRVDPDPGDEFDREPAFATFRAVGGGLDFTLACVHVTWGSSVEPRKAEIRALVDVWDRTLASVASDQDLILVGDFNRNIDDDAFEPLLDLPGLFRANEDTGPTVVAPSKSTYDQVFLSTEETFEWTGEWGTREFDRTQFAGDSSAAKLACSDHRPVSITLLLTAEDDD